MGPFTLMSSAEAADLLADLEQTLAQESTVYPHSQGAYVIEATDQKVSTTVGRSNYETSYWAMNYRDRHLDSLAVLDLFQHLALTV
ncbi:MAG: hypothetical protein AAF215_17730 [Cyanobacteria bacterium P01_A01_bin.123]